ncbi:MAG TPA: hypothetical protein VFK89_02335 [Actinomycetota bacterium]|nr:hypothetical protein [Actinomycetota bacterium]
MKTLRITMVVALAGLMSLGGTARAGDFSPKMTFDLSDKTVGANPAMTVTVDQDNNEEELANVTLSIPKGFTLPADDAIPNNDTLGTGSITIHVGPGCRPGGPADADVALSNIPATLKETDRTDEQKDAGVYAAWLLDISGVTTVPLEITGSPKTGFTAFGEIAANDNTCPPFSFSLTVNATSASGVPILVNPKKAGKKVFAGTLQSADSGTAVTLKTPIVITK